MHKNFATLHFHIKQYRANSYDIVITLGKRNWTISLGSLALLGIFPMAINSIILMAPNSHIYTLMVYASVIIYLLPVVILDLTAKELFPLVLTHIKKRILQIMEIGTILFFPSPYGTMSICPMEIIPPCTIQLSKQTIILIP